MLRSIISTLNFVLIRPLLMSALNHYTPAEIAATRQWVEHWKRVGPILERVEHDELRHRSFEDNWERIDGLLQFGFDVPHDQRPVTSGLVEQQRVFAKARG
ncbi:MAG TPA: hypothetical protein VGJ15_01855 [Pirellulales bacterium]|jgi:hypothetical protein